MVSDFKKLVAARFLFTFGVEMQGVLLGWRMYELTHNTFYLAMIGLAEAIPALSLALYAGYLVDRSRPLNIFRWVIVGSALSGLVLWLSQTPELHVSDRAQIIALFAASFITGAARSFSQPSLYAILPRLVERKTLTRDLAMMTSAMQIARISGPGLGGLIFGATNMATTAGMVCIELVAAIAILISIKTKLEPPEPSATPGSIYQELFSGAKFVFGHPILFPALTIDMVSVLFGGVTGLLPVYAQDILKVGPKGLGALRAAPALGAALVSLWLTRTGLKKSAGAWLFAAITGFGICTLVFGISENFYLSVAALGLSGGFDSISVIVRSTAVQLSSPDSMRGRISAVNSIFIGSSNEIGEVESGLTARWFGTVPAVIFGGAMCLVTVAVCAVFSPALRKLDLGALETAGNEPKQA